MKNKKQFVADYYGLDFHKRKLLYKLDELKQSLFDNNIEFLLDDLAEVASAIELIVLKLDCEHEIRRMKDFKIDSQIININRNKYTPIDTKEKKEKEYFSPHWSGLLIECYKRLQNGSGCTNCQILPNLETMPTCNLKFKVKELIKTIGKPKSKSTFFNVDITPIMAQTLNHLINKNEISFNDLTYSEKAVLSDLYLIALNYGFIPKYPTKKFYQFVEFIKENKEEVII